VGEKEDRKTVGGTRTMHNERGVVSYYVYQDKFLGREDQRDGEKVKRCDPV